MRSLSRNLDEQLCLFFYFLKTEPVFNQGDQRAFNDGFKNVY